MKVTHIYYKMPFVVLIGLMAGRWSQVCQSSDFLHKEMMLLLMWEATLSAFKQIALNRLCCVSPAPQSGLKGQELSQYWAWIQSATKQNMALEITTDAQCLPACPSVMEEATFPARNPCPRPPQAPQITPCAHPVNGTGRRKNSAFILNLV